MKGLILKDIMCLKHQLQVFVFVMIGVVFTSILFVLSARYGNLAMAGQEMLRAEQASDIDVNNLASVALVLFMLLPIATVGDMANVFQADGKAGFYRIAGALPLPISKRLLAKFLTIYALFGIGTLLDVTLAGILSLLTDLIRFRDFLGIILSAASVMSIYSALVIFFCILLGYGSQAYAQIFSLLLMAITLILCNLGYFRSLIQSIMTDQTGAFDMAVFWRPLDFIKEKSWILVLIAAALSIVSYSISLKAAVRKRGVI
ncbi:MAG: ABC-2 transporter permease [Lachnospiraceae bacterium]|nr:ABC-2 transporter permease [Lachnospiraceae bacterium]